MSAAVLSSAGYLVAGLDLLRRAARGPRAQRPLLAVAASWLAALGAGSAAFHRRPDGTWGHAVHDAAIVGTLALAVAVHLRGPAAPSQPRSLLLLTAPPAATLICALRGHATTAQQVAAAAAAALTALDRPAAAAALSPLLPAAAAELAGRRLERPDGHALWHLGTALAAHRWTLAALLSASRPGEGGGDGKDRRRSAVVAGNPSGATR